MLNTENLSLENSEKRHPSRRWNDRFPLDMEACVITGGRKIWCEAVNISICGARVRLDTTDGVDEEITLKIPRAGVDCIAQVVWSDETDIGVKFLKKRRWYHISSLRK